MQGLFSLLPRNIFQLTNLMFLAFLIDQIQQAVSTIFKTIWKELKTKKKLM